MIGGVPQPSFPIGADDEVALRDREERLEVADDLHDVPDDVRREQHAADARRCERPARSASVSSERLSPSSPPTPISVKPKPELNRRELRGDEESSAKPLLPSGIFVLMMPMALSAKRPWNDSSSAPMYSPFASSKERKPPPTIGPAATRKPNTTRRLEPEVELCRLRDCPRCPAGMRSSRSRPCSARPLRSARVWRRMSAPMLAESSPFFRPAVSVSASMEIGPSSMCVGSRTSSVLESR